MSVRVRFAPSPTGALHIGGVRTALYNYLFAKKNNGTFILRIEDTDQSRFVEGAEDYIRQSLAWAGISPDEGVAEGGDFGPYKQSERKDIYKQYTDQLLAEGKAYIAFDTPEELDEMRDRLKEARVANPQYNAVTRMQMKNSLTLSEEEVKELIDAGTPYVVRIKLPKNEDVRFKDIVRGWVVVNTATLDDKILMKSDGMPTYHMANIVDDHLMEITHVIRGEEWLPSAPLHVLLYEYLGWEPPEFAHLPLLLKPDGNGKLSKRAADKLGFPIFPLNWTDPQTGELSVGFKEAGYLPDAFINFLALLGWNPGGENEFFSLEELVEIFTLEKINKSGARFDIEKAKWFNQQYLRSKSSEVLAEEFINLVGDKADKALATRIVDSLKDRVTFVKEMVEAGSFYFERPTEYDAKTVKKKWNDLAIEKLKGYAAELSKHDSVTSDEAKTVLTDYLAKDETPLGRVMPALRLALTGQGGGPDLMEIISILGPTEVAARIDLAISSIKND
ncbi:glutamate--tRNA ligase [Roseivirga pacifica]|uniref:glutamate--tRNA ligase n=1 Tax=Roseivirga pacifica TaxID=1267423 RepID=UPI002094B395|nr:glutamate--tRNA ligase [Roseivirga pacifica]MCO6359715.1 glutamate--tRNA ligase [Roseivirga pacifica]MCO6367085.1 glutamate--tRNA ligase [Roseivirga pacifica]MCO6370383.1 glutamate--tRNA ligase [Roseivirga pacifica]MCO6374742.1 glutamate--tRNA ligase [Roseivirga pacifica]MCO6380000.1 glutamate--tRNA ligase [Roseivirga pacifica]